MALRFQFDETKAVETLAYIATRWPGVTAFYASKILFFAEKLHLNRYGRPIVADTFIAMPNGPVPSTIYDFIEGNLDQAGDPEAITKAIEIERNQFAHIKALRPADRDALSPSDIECLDEAIALCRGQSFKALSNRTHQERSYLEASGNGAMDYEAFIDEDNPHRAELLDEAREFAVYGVL
jgi:uncharacterized phage-associated protein